MKTTIQCTLRFRFGFSSAFVNQVNVHFIPREEREETTTAAAAMNTKKIHVFVAFGFFVVVVFVKLDSQECVFQLS